MANTNNGVNLDVLSMTSLDVLKTEGIPLSSFTTDFTGDIMSRGETVTTRFAGLPTVKDFTAGKSADDQSTTSRTITLDTYRGVSMAFTDLERTYSPLELAELFVRPAISQLVDDTINNILSLVTAASFTNNVVVADGALDADTVADLAGGLSSRKVPQAGRSLIIKPTNMASLTKDGAIHAASDGPAGTGPIKEHRLPRLHGFDVKEYNGTIPTNSEGLAGIACGKQGLIIAARQVVAPKEGTWYGNVINIQDEASGLPIQIREYYDNAVGLCYEFGILYGYKVGISNYLTRISTV